MVIFLALLGLVAGSFLNVLILRYDPGKENSLRTFGGRSRCMHCGVQLRWYELIPVLSFVLQLGKCRSCNKGILLQYPVIELASAAVFVFVPDVVHGLLSQSAAAPSLFAVAWMSALWIAVLLSLFAAFFIDARHYVIPNYLNLFIFVLGAVWCVLGSGAFTGFYADLFLFPGIFFDSFVLQHLLGGVLGGVLFLLVILASRGRGMGLGDAKLMAGLGLLFGYPDVLLVVMLAFILGTLYAVPLLARGTKGMKDMLPFGPFIVLAALIVFFFGARLLGAYFGIIEKIGG
jgi:prepilin signal peptidase PulO-like enzyme (type II secretory pathway)